MAEALGVPAAAAARRCRSVKNARWPRNAIDRFRPGPAGARRAAPAAEADRATLIRRVTLDLTGLPPTPAEVDAFLADASPDAYEKVVDRLLASPRYGERMAVRWLDAARYADTNGYQSDGERIMWRWRDWVIDAFNRNMPFDQFTIEQLAGDLLPDATLEQKIATGFNRNHRGNAEGGIIPEEYAVEYVVDRVETTATVWLGPDAWAAAAATITSSIRSRRRSSTSSSPIFNNVPERGKAIKYGNSPPLIKAPTPRAAGASCSELDAQLAERAEALRGLQPEMATAQAAWEKIARAARRAASVVAVDRLARAASAGWRHDEQDRRRVAFETAMPRSTPAASARPSTSTASASSTPATSASFGFYDKFSLGAWVYPRRRQGGTILSRMTDADRADGYSCRLKTARCRSTWSSAGWTTPSASKPSERCAPDRWHHVVVTYDGSRLAAGVKVYVDGQPEKLKVAARRPEPDVRDEGAVADRRRRRPGNRFHGADRRRAHLRRRA